MDLFLLLWKVVDYVNDHPEIVNPVFIPENVEIRARGIQPHFTVCDEWAGFSVILNTGEIIPVILFSHEITRLFE